MRENPESRVLDASIHGKVVGIAVAANSGFVVTEHGQSCEVANPLIDISDLANGVGVVGVGRVVQGKSEVLQVGPVVLRSIGFLGIAARGVGIWIALVG